MEPHHVALPRRQRLHRFLESRLEFGSVSHLEELQLRVVLRGRNIERGLRQHFAITRPHMMKSPSDRRHTHEPFQLAAPRVLQYRGSISPNEQLLAQDLLYIADKRGRSTQARERWLDDPKISLFERGYGCLVTVCAGAGNVNLLGVDGTKAVDERAARGDLAGQLPEEDKWRYVDLGPRRSRLLK